MKGRKCSSPGNIRWLSGRSAGGEDRHPSLQPKRPNRLSGSQELPYGEAAVMNSVGSAGHSWPLGATVVDGGINFSVFSRSATGVELLLFDREDDARPVRAISIEPATNRTYHYWHVFVPGVEVGRIYGYRVDGAFDPLSGMRFDPAKVLLDPYGRGTVVPNNYSRDAARQAGDNAAKAMKSVAVDVHTYDWEG